MISGSKVVISLETGFSTLRTSLFDLDKNDQLLRESLDLVNEQGEVAMVQVVHYQ